MHFCNIRGKNRHIRLMTVRINRAVIGGAKLRVAKNLGVGLGGSFVSPGNACTAEHGLTDVPCGQRDLGGTYVRHFETQRYAYRSRLVYRGARRLLHVQADTIRGEATGLEV
jgi:hypothetical protein